MIRIKEIIWKEIEIECTDETYLDGMLNDIQIISIHENDGYSIYSYLFDKGFDKDNVYTTLEEAKVEATKRVEKFVFGLIDMRDYKLDELLK